MLHNSNLKIETAVANQSGAMEADTISKNGRSLKSQMSRGFFFKYLVIAAFGVAVTFTSCGGGSGSGGGNTPSSVVKKALNAIIKKDADTAFTYFYNLSENEKESERRQLESDSDYSIVKFEIQDERIFDNGEKAEVIVKVFFKNGSDYINKIPLVKTSNGWKLVKN